MPPPLLRALLRGPKDLLTGPNASILNSAMQGTKPLAHGTMGKFSIKATAAPYHSFLCLSFSPVSCLHFASYHFKV